MLLAPMVIVLGLMARGASKDDPAASAPSARPPRCLVRARLRRVVGVNGLIVIPAETKIWIAAATTFLLSVALAAMGLEYGTRAASNRPCSDRFRVELEVALAASYKNLY
jgi:uncharacterized membrane protein YadS